MMLHAKLMHSSGSFRCESLDKNLTLGFGLDGSAVLHLLVHCHRAGWCKPWINYSSPHRN